MSNKLQVDRSISGQAIIVLGVIIAFSLIMVTGLYGYELNRIALARAELQSATEAAALTAAATLASQDMADPSAAQTNAINTGLNMLRTNSVVGNALTNAQTTSSLSSTPAANQTLVYFEFLDPNNNRAVVPLGDSRGKIVRVTSIFGLSPSFASFLPISTAAINATSSGGVPDMDIVVCFDVSGSIDDQTPVTFVRRQWNSSKNKIDYLVASTPAGSAAGASANGRIYDIIGPVPTGTRVNGVYPQNLSNSDDSTRWPLNFSEASTASKGLRGTSDAGAPPGNYPPGKSGLGNNYTFTDMVVNVDGKNQFQGYTSPDGFAFPDLATLVEASRGNLEDGNVFQQSKAATGVPTSVLPKVGYKAKYWNLAESNLHPLWDAQDAAREFYTIMNNNTNAHFGLIAFSDNAGTASTTVYTEPRIDSTYSVAGNVNAPVPNISLNSSQQVTNYSAIIQALPTTVATNSTNIGDAVHKAVQQLTGQSRIGSKKAIVLFTDGQPTAGGPLDNDPWTNARKSAVEAKNAGIPIYTIGLAQNSEIIPNEIGILNDTNSNVNSGGMAAIAGNGGKFYLVTDQRLLRNTFENVARQLVQLVR